MIYPTLLISIIEVLIVTIPVLLSVAFVTIAERKTMASMQRRLGPNIVGYYGLLQAFADALKLLLKEYVSPTQANLILFFLGPIITLIFSLLGYAVIPYGPGLALADFNLGILYMLAMSSLSTYGILLAGWSANSKYAFLGSNWPVKDKNLSMKQTISGKFIKILLDTLIVSCNICASKVKILLNMNNPQVTKAFNSWVGTSEAIRLLSININTNRHFTDMSSKKKKWDQWLAGLIDGSGNFYLTKNGYASLEIKMDIRDEHALQIVKNVYGGSIKLVSGTNSLTYSLRHKSGFLSLVNDVNGYVRNSYRLIQLNKICLKYQLTLIYPAKLKYDNSWLSGLFDAQGKLTINCSNGQISLSILQKTSEILQPLLELYKGFVYIDRTTQSFIWYITKREDILNLVEYFKKHPSRSARKNRLHLIHKCYELKDQKANEALPETCLGKSWQYFISKWLKYEQ